jgi:hypothetical protein
VIDINFNLGRNVPTAQQVIEVIRPELRMIRAFHMGVIDRMRAEQIQCDPDLNMTDGGDKVAAGAVFAALRESAVGSVQQWARDIGLAYDKGRVEEFVHSCLIAAESEVCERLPSGLKALEY